MKFARPVIVACFVATLAAFAAPIAGAQGIAVGGNAAHEDLTYLEFSGPVTLPGVTLPAGKYMFHLVSPSTSRDIVQVKAGDEFQVFGTWFTVNAQRGPNVGKPEVHFIETPENMPRAIRSWWFASKRSGHEFIYSKEQAMILAKASGEPVLTTGSSASATDIRSDDIKTMTPSGEIVDFEAEAQVAQAETTAPPNLDRPLGTSGQEPARQSLPRTASNLWLVGLIGLSALSGAVSLRLLTANRV